ncbi:MAG: helix-turn-helix domain-containing protein [Ignavibacteriaceae bacterium]
MFDKISEELKTARENAELTIQQLAAKTRIDLKFIEFIEKGNLTFLPEIYIKAFIRDYSKVVGIDEKIMMKKFDAAKKGQSFNEINQSEGDAKKAKTTDEDSKLKNKFYSSLPYTSEEELARQKEAVIQYKKKMIIAASAAGLLLLFVIVYFAFIKGSSEIIVTEKPYSEVVKENQQRDNLTKPQPKTNDTTFVASPSDSLSLMIESKDTSWLKILLDGKTENVFTLFPYSKKEIKAKKNYQLTIGNAAAIQLALNGKPLNFTGKKNEVKQVSIDSAGLKFLTPPQSQIQK